MPDALPQKANRTLGPSEPLTDLPDRVALQTHYQTGAFLLQAGKKAPQFFLPIP
jgi:hypothetical protein